MSNNKQSSIEWLIEQIEQHIVTFGSIQPNVINKLKEQAKAMHKEEIITAFCVGYDHDGGNYDDAETKYYNETYGK